MEAKLHACAVHCGIGSESEKALRKAIKVIAHGVRKFSMLKNKYDFTLCQSRLHTASKIFIRHKIIRIIGFDYFCFWHL